MSKKQKIFDDILMVRADYCVPVISKSECSKCPLHVDGTVYGCKLTDLVIHLRENYADDEEEMEEDDD